MNGESVADYTDRPYALGLYEKAISTAGSYEMAFSYGVYLLSKSDNPRRLLTMKTIG